MTKKKKFCIAAIIVAAILFTVTVFGLFIHKAENVNLSEINQTGNESGNTDNAFVVTPQKKAAAVALSAEVYSSGDANESYLITATTTNYDGNVSWSVDWTGTTVYWNSAEKTQTATDCVSLFIVNNRSVLVECLQPFGQPIAVTATINNGKPVSDVCICDYEQRVSVTGMGIGFNTFNSDGSLGKALIEITGIAPAPIRLDGSSSLEYSCGVYAHSYTQESENCNSGIYFTITPNAEVIEDFGLDGYAFKSYTGTFDTAYSGTIDGFFDRAWGEYAIAGTEYTLINFASAVWNATNGNGSRFDNVAVYTLTIYGLPCGKVEYGYEVDMYWLNEYVKSAASVSLNRSNILF